MLGSFLPSCPNVRSLFLEGNCPPIAAQNYHHLLTEESNLLTLSLRHNGITDVGAENIAKVNTMIQSCPKLWLS